MLGIRLILSGRRGTGEMKDVGERLRLKRQRKFVDDVMLNELETTRPNQMGDVAETARLEVVEYNHAGAIGDQAIAKMRANEPGSAGHEREFFQKRHGRLPLP